MGPELGATFVPSGFDDYYMPEVAAPSPQRVTPQVPQNMQEGLQRMELEARDEESRPNSEQSYRHAREPSLSAYTGHSSQPALPPKDVQSPDADIRAYQNADSRTQKLDTMSFDAPSFSPFPKVKGDNIPPSDEEKEEILWNARKHVLHSQNVSMQIIWARDVLFWAEISMDAAAREPAEGQRSSTPRMEHELRTDALNIINYLARQEHPDALYMRSKWLEFGKFGNRVDKREAYMGYKKAAELGNARSEYRMGMLYEQSNDISKAKEHYYKGLSLNDSAAQYRMGMMSLLGQHGETKDFSRGLERIQLAANNSDEDAPQGAYVYGMLVAKELPDIAIPEELLPQNLETAKMYIEKSAYLGFAKAQLKMGQAHELCQLGCDFNACKSLHYYALAAKQGLPEAALGVSRWFLFGYEGVFKKNEEYAYKYAMEAANAKLATGAFAMGYYNEIGIHVGKNLSEAKRWYRTAAEAGNQDAVGRLESLDHDKSLSKTDHETTTLTRIKSQHGSMRGKRPERFKQANQMPTLSEDSSSSRPHPPPKVADQAGPLPTKPYAPAGQLDFPDPSRPASDRPPAFNIRLNDGGPNMRPHSTAPYPEDDRPKPLNLSRPKSAAPYPEDDVRHHSQGQGYNPNGRLSAAPQADRPGSAFGIRPPAAASGPRPLPATQSMSNLRPHPDADPRGRMASGGWDRQGGPGFRQPSPGPPGRTYPDDPRGRPVSAQQYPPNGLANTMRPQQSGAHPPNLGPGPPSRPHGEMLMNASHDPRIPRPMSEVPPQPQYASSGRPASAASAPLPRPPTVGRPGASQSPGPRLDNKTSSMGAGAGAGAAPKPSKGPATFEEMGISQGKQDSDCVVI